MKTRTGGFCACGTQTHSRSCSCLAVVHKHIFGLVLVVLDQIRRHGLVGDKTSVFRNTGFGAIPIALYTEAVDADANKRTGPVDASTTKARAPAESTVVGIRLGVGLTAIDGRGIAIAEAINADE